MNKKIILYSNSSVSFVQLLRAVYAIACFPARRSKICFLFRDGTCGAKGVVLSF